MMHLQEALLPYGFMDRISSLKPYLNQCRFVCFQLKTDQSNLSHAAQNMH